jgi:hypothetical protein
MKEAISIIMLFIAAAALLGFLIQIVTWIIERKND